jgi:hypothetical protein
MARLLSPCEKTGEDGIIFYVKERIIIFNPRRDVLSGDIENAGQLEIIMQIPHTLS